MNPADMIEVHASANPAEIAALRSALGGAGLGVLVRGDLTLAHRACVIPARVLVSSTDAGRAIEIRRTVLGR